MGTLVMALGVNAAGLVVASPAEAATLVNDGDFNGSSTYSPPSGGFTELSSSDASASGIPSWTVSDGSVDWVNGLWNGPSDDNPFSVDMNGSSPGTLEQTIATDSGQSYTLTFELSANPTCGSIATDLEVDWNGTAVAPDYVVTPTWDTATMQYVTETANVTGTGSDVLSFISHTGGACGSVIADVGLSASSGSPVPTVAVSCDPATVQFNQSTTCTATVTGNSSATPSGSVTFDSSAKKFSLVDSPCSLTGTGATATCSVTYTPTGAGMTQQVITASYGGEASYAPNSGQVTLPVQQRTTTTSVDCTNTTVTVGGSTTCTATVTDTGPGTATTPTGRVRFGGTNDDTFTGAPCTLSGTGSTASCSVTYTPVKVAKGTHTVTATYMPLSGHAAGRGQTSETVTNPVSGGPRSAIFAKGTSCSGTGIQLQAGNLTLSGAITSNGPMLASGHNNTFTSGTYGGPNNCSWTDNSGGSNTFGSSTSPTRSTTDQPWPEDFTSYFPVGSGANPFSGDASCTFTGTDLNIQNESGQTLPSATYCYNSIEFNSPNLSCTCTFVAKSMEFNQGPDNFTPYFQDLRFYDMATNPILNPNGTSLLGGGTGFFPNATNLIIGAPSGTVSGFVEAQGVTINGGGPTTWNGTGPPVGGAT